jgi:hypothetical protein
MNRFGPIAACVALAALSSACAPAIDLKQAIQVTDVSTGWFDAGIVNGQNKLVPSVTFTLKNTSDDRLSGLSLNVVFRAEGETEDWDDVFVQRVQFGDNGQTEPLTVRPEKGYTGAPPQSRADMLKHSMFKDLTAKVFAKQSSSQWVELHAVKLERRLLTQ